MAGLTFTDNRSLANALRAVIKKGSFIANVDRENHPALQFVLSTSTPKAIQPAATTTLEMNVETREGPNGELQTEDMFQQIAPTRGGTLERASWSTFRKVHKMAFDQEELAIAGGMAKNPELLYNWYEQKRSSSSAKLCNKFDELFTFGPRTLAQLATREVRGILQQVGFSMNQTTGAYVANPDGGFVGQRYRLMSGEVVTLRDGIDPTLPENPYWRNWAATDDELGFSHTLVDKIALAHSRTNFTSSTMQVISPEAVDAPKKVANPEDNYSTVRRCVIFMGERRYRALRNMFSLGRQEIGNDPLVSMENKTLDMARFACMRRLDDVFGNPIIGLSREHIGLFKFPGYWNRDISIDGEDGSDMTFIEGQRWIGALINQNPRVGCFTIHASW